MCSKNDIHEAVALLKPRHLLLLLHHTAAQSDYHMRILTLQAVQVSEPSVYLEIGIFTDCTCIIKDKIRVFCLSLFKTCLLEDSQKLLRISGVHLTAEGLDICEGTASVSLFKLPDPFPAFRHKIILPGGFSCGRP